MAKKKDEFDFEDFFWITVFTIGGLWLLRKILSEPKGKVGIFGFLWKRDLPDYVDRNGNRIFNKELESFTPNEVGEIIRMIIKARKSDKLSMPFFKTLKGTPITAELRDGHFRILMYQIKADDYLLLSIFKKKTDETPKNEIDKAERRLQEYLNRK